MIPQPLLLMHLCQSPLARSWELLPGSMASKRGGHAVAAAGGQLYALGGFNSVQAIPHCEAYEPRVGRGRGRGKGRGVLQGSLLEQAHDQKVNCKPRCEVWQSMNRNNYACSATRVHASNTAPRLHPSPHTTLQMNAWRQIADMSDARAYGSSASLGSTVFAVGGLQSDMQVGSAAACPM